MCLTERLFSASSEGETERWRDGETERLGDRGMEGWRDGGTTLFFLLRDEFDAIGFCLDLSLIPHPVTPSLSLCLSVSLSLCLSVSAVSAVFRYCDAQRSVNSYRFSPPLALSSIRTTAV